MGASPKIAIIYLAAFRFWWGWGGSAKDTPNRAQEPKKKPPKANTKEGNLAAFRRGSLEYAL